MSTYIYSDGCCTNNNLENEVASWSYVVADENGATIEASTGRVIGAQNNNRAELTAFIKALQYIRNERNGKFIMRVDFEALYLYYNGQVRPKANFDLYRQIDYLMNVCGDRITVEKVKSPKSYYNIINSINDLINKSFEKSKKLFSNQSLKS